MILFLSYLQVWWGAQTPTWNHCGKTNAGNKRRNEWKTWHLGIWQVDYHMAGFPSEWSDNECSDELCLVLPLHSRPLKGWASVFKLNCTIRVTVLETALSFHKEKASAQHIAEFVILMHDSLFIRCTLQKRTFTDIYFCVYGIIWQLINENTFYFSYSD